MAQRLAKATAPVNVLLPLQGVEQWDREGEPAHDPEALRAFTDEIRKVIKDPLQLTEIDAHINDQAFSDCALEIFDQWIKDGIVKNEPT